MNKKIISRMLDQLTKIPVITGKMVSWLTIGMVLLLTANILSSWLLNTSSILVSESITWMHSANFLLAAAYTLNANEHVRVDIFYSKLSSQKKALVDFLGTLLLLLPVSIFIIWSSWSYVMLSWKINEVSAEAGGMPATFIIKGFLILMPVLLILEGINQMLVHYQTFMNKESLTMADNGANQ